MEVGASNCAAGELHEELVLDPPTGDDQDEIPAGSIDVRNVEEVRHSRDRLDDGVSASSARGIVCGYDACDVGEVVEMEQFATQSSDFE